MNTRPGPCNFPGSLSDNKIPPFCSTVDFSAPYGRKGVKIQISQPQVLSYQESSSISVDESGASSKQIQGGQKKVILPHPWPCLSPCQHSSISPGFPRGKKVTPIAVTEIHTIPSLRPGHSAQSSIE